MEEWGNKWGFRFSVDKTQVMCFSKKRVNPKVQITLYGQPLKQVLCIRFLGVWMDHKLTYGEHIQKVITKCKKAVNIMRCLIGSNWGASMRSLKHIYTALIRSASDYACITYGSAAKSHLQKLDVIQAQALRLCCGAFKTSPVPALQVEVGEMPLSLRRLQLSMTYWATLQGHRQNHPTKAVLDKCWEHGCKHFNSFGWVGDGEAEKLGLTKLSLSCTVALPATPPWFFPMPTVDLETAKLSKHSNEYGGMNNMVQQYLSIKYNDMVQVYTDGSKDPDSGKTEAAVYIPEFETSLK